VTGNPADRGPETEVPHSARIWNYWLGGTDNYPVDRAAGDEYARVFPAITEVARVQREFQARVVRFLARDAGIAQFLDIGAGLPAADNTHQIAQRQAPRSRVLYVDHDPMVVERSQVMLAGSPPGSCGYVQGDLRDPDAITATAPMILDLSQPVALMLMGVMGHLADEEAYRSVRRLVSVLPPGSYLALADGISSGEAFEEAQQGYDDTGAIPYRLRTPGQVTAFFDGLDLAEPGVVPCEQWRPGPGQFTPSGQYAYGGTGRRAT
jgi:O-methyltransferase involved in polyketide biosynthesis